jgi:hypothetical protein
VIKMAEDKNKNRIPTSPDSFRFNPQQVTRLEPTPEEPQTVTFGWHSGPTRPLYTPQSRPEDMIKRVTLKKPEA